MGIQLNQIDKEKNVATGGNAILDFLNKDISFSSKLTLKKKERFYSELHILLSAGVDIKTALDLIVEDQQKKADKLLFKNIADSVLKGSSVSDALKKDNSFTPYEYYSIQIGEESGRIVMVLEELAAYYNKRISQKRKMVNAFSYPVLVLTIAFAAVAFLMTFLVPMFVDVFNRFNSDLPALTKLVVNISDAFKAYFGYVVFFIFLIVLFILLIRKKESYQRIVSSVLIRIPFIGNLIKMSYLERFFGTMSLLIASRTPTMKAIQLTRQMIGFYAFQQELRSVEADILHGKLLYESLKKSVFFDKRTVSLIKVAEEVNQLDSIFSKLHSQIGEELEYRMGILSSMMEPFLIIFVGILVAVILVAMYLPMFELSSTIY